MKWTKLIEHTQKHIGRGRVLRMPSAWPYEDFVDFMVYDPAEVGRGMGLIVTSGNKAGLRLVRLPEESQGDAFGAIETKWIIKNWAEWVYPECDVADVYIADNYGVPTSLPE